MPRTVQETVAQPETIEDWVPINHMFFDPAYSRPLDMAFVRKLAALWDDRKVGVLYLSLRNDGRYAIIDGCHRREACLLARGESATLPARAFIDLTIAQEAALWDAFNRFRRQPQQVDIFRGRLASGDETAVLILRAVEVAGLTLALRGRQRGASIVAVTALESAYRRLGDQGLVVLLRLLREAFGEQERGYQAPAIDGLSMVWGRYGDLVNRRRLVDTLQRVGATQLLRLAHEYRAIHLGTSIAGAWARVVVIQYNRGLRAHPLPEWEGNA